MASDQRTSFGHQSVYLAAIDGGRMVGVFPIVWLKSLLFGNIACSMPFVNYGGPCGETDEIEQELLRAGQAVVDDWGVDYLEIRRRRKLESDYPCSEHKVSMTIELAPDPETLFANFKTGQRREIRSRVQERLRHQARA